MSLVIELCELPPVLRGPDDPDYHGQVPKRARFMAPDAARALLAMNDEVAGMLGFTDIYRSAEASLAAIQSKRGAQPPAFSGHNFGLSEDDDVDPNLKRLKIPYPELVALHERYGFYGHRLDGQRGFEDWHHNYFGDRADEFLARAERDDRSTWARPLEAAIQARYGLALSLSPTDAQLALQKLGLYQGEVDGKIGPISRAALGAFQRSWMLADTRQLDARTQRTLAFVAAERRIVPL